ncbi:barstar family protein [Microbulbifer sp. JMSA004]|uniref:barstar family protein n=1 Tax=Microbulbifer sp. JMSA004 TaxID=3243370 RepID=UPI004039BB64
MAEFKLDLKTLAYGPVAKYFDLALFEKDISWYEDAGYKVYFLDGEKWYTMESFHSDCHEVFSFPSYYGRNWGAFDDVISEIERGSQGDVLVCVRNFDSWSKRDISNSQVFLEIMSDQTYSYLVYGRKFVTLIHSNDPNLSIREVGAKSVHWNQKEWNESDRREKC